MSDDRQAFGYTRVSTREQSERGVSLDAQRSAILRACETHGWEFADLLIDAGVSGRSTKRRAGLAEALDRVCEARGVLVVYSLSRLARSAADAERICERLRAGGADLLSVTEPIDTTSAMGRAFFGIVSVFARLESDLTGERVAAANAETQARLGYRTQGRQPYGWRLDESGRRVAEEVEQRVLSQIVTLRRAGHTTRRIADRLNRDGVPSPKARRGYADSAGGRWHAGTVYVQLARVAPDLCDLGTRRPPFVWTDQARELLGTMADRALAELLDCSRVTVTRERVRLGIPPHSPRNSPRKTRDDN